RCTIRAGRPPQLWRFGGGLKRSVQHIDRFLAPSQFVHDKHRELGLSLPATVLPYFLPVPAPPPQDDPSPHARPYFLFVGRLVKVKGLQTLLSVVRSYTEADFLVAGEGDYAATLQDAARDLPNIRFLGVQSYARLRALYRHAIALIVPSICYEVSSM